MDPECPRFWGCKPCHRISFFGVLYDGFDRFFPYSPIIAKHNIIYGVFFWILTLFGLHSPTGVWTLDLSWDLRVSIPGTNYELHTSYCAAGKPTKYTNENEIIEDLQMRISKQEQEIATLKQKLLLAKNVTPDKNKQNRSYGFVEPRIDTGLPYKPGW